MSLLILIVQNLPSLSLSSTLPALVTTTLKPIKLRFETRDLAPLVVDIVDIAFLSFSPYKKASSVLLKACFQSCDLASHTASMRMRSFCFSKASWNLDLASLQPSKLGASSPPECKCRTNNVQLVQYAIRGRTSGSRQGYISFQSRAGSRGFDCMNRE